MIITFCGHNNVSDLHKVRESKQQVQYLLNKIV